MSASPATTPAQPQAQSPAPTPAQAQTPAQVPSSAPSSSTPVPPSGYLSASLYVGDLAPDVSEGNLFEVFINIGPVSLVRVCRDATARRRSLGYAYVNFHNHDDAQRALETLNTTPIKGRPCRIMWSQRDPTLRKSGVGNLFVKNLDKSVDQKLLFDLFAPFGNILSCKVALDSNNQPKGYGFVHFENEESATAAVAKLNNTVFSGKEIFVGPFVSRKERQSPGSEEQYTNLYVKNLDENVNEEKLREIFGKHGELTSVVVMTDSNGKSKCFGFVNFASHEQASAAMEALDKTTITENGKTIFVGKAQKRAERQAELRFKHDGFRREQFPRQQYYQEAPPPSQPQEFNVYLKDLDAKVDEQRLKDEFSKFGEVVSVKLIRDDKGVSRGYAFITYKTAEEANKAVTAMKGHVLEGKPIYTALARKRDGRRDQTRGGPRWATYPQGQNAPSRRGRSQHNQRNNGNNGNNNYQRGNNSNRGGNRRNSASHNQNNNAAAAVPSTQAGSAASSSPAVIRPLSSSITVPVEREKWTQHSQLGNEASEDTTLKNKPEAAVSTSTPSAESAAPSKPLSDEVKALIESAGTDNQSQLSTVAEKLYPQIEQLQPELAGKITGMLMERFSNAIDLAAFIEDQEGLKQKVDEAVQLLQASEAKPEETAQ